MCAHLDSCIELHTITKQLEENLTVAGLIWWISVLKEHIDTAFLNRIIMQIRQFAVDKKQDLSNIKLVVNDTVDKEKLTYTSDIQIHVVNFYRMVTYYHKYHALCPDNPHTINQQFNTRYRNDKNSALFLVGKPDHPHRTPVLIELINRGIKDKLTYSWYPGRPGSKLFNRVMHIMRTHGCTENIEDLARLHESSLDIPQDVPVFNMEETSFHYTGFPFDVSLYQNTSLSIVSETECNSDSIPHLAWTSEKIWKAIANHHPFVLAGDSNIITKLRMLGYETWDAYLKHDQHYANMSWEDHNAVSVKRAVDNVEHFLNSSHCGNQISELAKENSNLMDKHTRKEISDVFDNDLRLFESFMKHSRYPNLDNEKSICFSNQ